jgi:enoyl-CoA hydratase/carnithine racemase
VRGELAPPGLEVALCSDLVYLRVDSVLRLADRDQQPSAGLVWALSRAGRPALAAGLLDGGPMPASRAVALGLAQDLAAADRALPLPADHGPGALIAARDLMRSRAGGEAGLALELATFRLLFAAGEPEEGALAFLERRQPSFGGSEEE